MPAVDVSLIDALGAAHGIVCLVGAGGKKTTMYALAAAHPGRVLLSSTSHMYPYDRGRVDHVVTLAEADADPGDLSRYRRVAAAGATDTPKRVGGLPPGTIWRLFCEYAFDLGVIKADGARARWIKCPGAHEPLIPAFADTVIPVVSARAIGRVLDDRVAHRPAALAALLGIAEGAILTPAHVASLLASPDGALKGVRGATVVPLINMVDDDVLLRCAREAAQLALAATDRFERVVLASMSESVVRDVVVR